MRRVKSKPEKPQHTPIILSSFILFGKYHGKTIKDILNDPGYITWYCRKTHSQLHPEVTTAIQQLNHLAQ